MIALIKKLRPFHPLLVIALLAGASLTQAQTTSLDPREAAEIAKEAYIYGYSLITTNISKIQQSNVDQIYRPRANGKQPLLASPVGSFTNVRGYPPATFRGVSATNADTLYSVAWVDLAQPMVFSHPQIKARFFTFELVDLWMTVHDSVGTNTSGDKAMTYLLTRSDWQGQVPTGMIHISFPTQYMVILGRTYTQTNPQDLKVVHRLQDQYKLVPLSSYGKPYRFKAPPVVNNGISMVESPQKVISGFGLVGYFNMLTELMGSVAPPAPEDAPLLARMAKLGIIPGKPFDLNALSPEVRAALQSIPQDALNEMVGKWEALGQMRNGWRVTSVGGRYGTDYLLRASWAARGWPSQLPEVSVYPTTYVDRQGQPLRGENRYTLTFEKGSLPPIHPEAFWSITMYIADSDGLWFYPNPLNKLNVQYPRDSFKYNADGSLTLYIQNDSPGQEKASNWLPSPKGPFALTLRLYWPMTTSPSILNGTWNPPGVERIP